MDIAHDFRNRYKNFMTAKTKGPSKGNTAPATTAAPITITQANIYVAKHFPAWQQVILDSLRKLYAVNNTFPDNKVILAEINTKEEVKKYLKKAMPFVAYLKEQVNKKGLSALNSALDFDEFQVLVTNAQYLRNTLQVI